MEPANLLHIESLGTEWCDKDQIMLHACFQLLKDCVEKEHLLDGHIDWDHDAAHRDAKLVVMELYDWWMARAQAGPADPQDREQYGKDSEMLIRLINIRWALWT